MQPTCKMTKKQAGSYELNSPSNGDQYEARKLSVICEGVDDANGEASITHEVRAFISHNILLTLIAVDADASPWAFDALSFRITSTSNWTPNHQHTQTDWPTFAPHTAHTFDMPKSSQSTHWPSATLYGPPRITHRSNMHSAIVSDSPRR